jgi:hypothetical protein
VEQRSEEEGIAEAARHCLFASGALPLRERGDAGLEVQAGTARVEVEVGGISTFSGRGRGTSGVVSMSSRNESSCEFGMADSSGEWRTLGCGGDVTGEVWEGKEKRVGRMSEDEVTEEDYHLKSGNENGITTGRG